MNPILSELSVSNLAVVAHADVAFGSGLTVITGETGAGKSVLMGALELLTGGRAESTLVREGAKEAEVEAVFTGEKGPLTLRRVVRATGTSKAWVNDEAVSISELKELTKGLVDIHGPRANQQILEESFQRAALDSFGGVDLKDYTAAYQAWKRLVEEEKALNEDSAEGVAQEMDFLRFQVDEIAAAHLTEEDETLAERHATAAHAAEIVEDANALTEALGGDEGAANILVSQQGRLASMARHFPAAEEWTKEVEELTGRIEELSRTVADAVSKLEVDEDDFEALDQRLTLVNKLKRKYGASIAEILSAYEQKANRLEALEGRDARLAALKQEIAAALKQVKSAGLVVTKTRTAQAKKLAQAVTKELHDLGFVQAKFAVALESVEPQPHGCDRMVYLFEPNPGESARPLADIASSGEMARVMLALKAILAAHDKTAVLVFDEIDANIGGETGRAVGEKLRTVAKHHQVIAITHLPQSAVFGDRHLVVRKRVSEGRTLTTISEVTGDERVGEIARMLGGESLTSVVRKHAEEILQLSSRRRS